MRPEELVANIGPCTADVNDCEIVRALIVNKDTPGKLRDELSKAACSLCRLNIGL